MELTTTTQKQFASMREVVMKKTELLEKLVINKAKHDVILGNAIAGYWDMAKDKLESRRMEFMKTISEFGADVSREIEKINKRIEGKETLPQRLEIKTFALDTNLGLVYPQDHSKDYERAIAAMEASIYNEVSLSMDEFDAYVLNNWEWKNNFLAVNSIYVDNQRLKYKQLSQAGSKNTSGLASRYDETYATAVASANNMFLMSGCSSTANNF